MAYVYSKMSLMFHPLQFIFLNIESDIHLCPFSSKTLCFLLKQDIMHFSFKALVLLCSSTAVSSSFLPSLKCLELRKVLESIPIDRIVAYGQESCNEGRNLKPSDYEHGREHFQSVIQEETANMGVPDLSDSYLNLVDSMVEMGRQKCGMDKLSETGFCGDIPQTKALAECVKSNSWSLALSNIENIAPLLLSDNCEKQVAYFSNPKFLDEATPKQIQKLMINISG